MERIYFSVDSDILDHSFRSSPNVEQIPISADTVNPENKVSPKDFELLKVLGKGGYGKVFQVSRAQKTLVASTEKSTEPSKSWTADERTRESAQPHVRDRI